MSTTIRAVFDGEVLRPEQPVDLRRDAVYLVTIDVDATDPQSSSGSEEPYPLTELARISIDMGVTDLTERHHGTVPGASHPSN